MSRIQELLPEKLMKIIKDHLRSRCREFYLNAFRRNRFDEDSVTASFFTALALDSKLERIDGHQWSWSVEYSTTASKGKDPLEKVLGADVILFIEIVLPDGTMFRKGILVQSKMEKSLDRSKLKSQIAQMENFVQGSSVVLTYGSEGFRSSTGAQYLGNKGRRWNNYSSSFCDFIADEFMVCNYGIVDLYYDFNNNEATYSDSKNNRILFIPQRGVSEIKVRKLE